MKVSELTGALLDYWVARAEGAPAEQLRIWPAFGRLTERVVQRWPGKEFGKTWEASTNWAQGGQIIERECITVAWQPMKSEWMAGATSTTMLEFRWRGFSSEPLVAAMRAYVASKFGDEVVAAQGAQGEIGENAK